MEGKDPMERYVRNMKMLSPEENEGLKSFKVCVVGCGGLGGYTIEMLGRLGIGSITAIDGDVFSESNLNRQLLSHRGTLGKNKALTAMERMKLVNPHIQVRAIPEFLREENALEHLKGHHLIMDALDNIPSRMLIQAKAEELNIPFIHGAIAGWYGQVSTIFPGDRTLDLLYAQSSQKGIESSLDVYKRQVSMVSKP